MSDKFEIGSAGSINAMIQKRLRHAKRQSQGYYPNTDEPFNAREAKKMWRIAINWRNKVAHGKDYDGFFDLIEDSLCRRRAPRVYTPEECKQFQKERA
jgi:hypothetical protein